jgi:hypothetical protein
MKKMFFGLAAIVLLLSSCREKLSNPIIGKWKVVNIGMPKMDIASEVNTNIDSAGITGVDTAVKAMAEGVETMTNALSDLGGAMANTFMKGSTYEFKDDGTMSVFILFGSTDGKYSLTPDNKSLKMTMDGKEESYTVTSVNETQLIITKDGGGETWTFDKAK